VLSIAGGGLSVIRSQLPVDWVFANKDAPLYAHMETMPRLPVPDLGHTLEKYLYSVQPFLSESELNRTKMKVEEFGAPGGLGETLDTRLRAKMKSSPDTSWIAEWWENAAYLDYRDSIAFYVSYFYHFADDEARTTSTSRAAALIAGFAELAQEVTTGSLEPELTGRAGSPPMCSNGYKFLFNSCRVPESERDAEHCYDPSLYRGEVVISRKQQLFLLNIAGMPTDAIEKHLEHIIAVADEADAPVPSLGVLTGTNRDDWCAARTDMLQSPVNAASLEKIERAMFVVCLDDASPTDPTDVGRTSLNAIGNRFMDKTLQLVVYENGKAAFIGEHARSDGSPTANLCDLLLTRQSTGAFNHSVPAAGGSNVAPCEKLLFELSPAVVAAVAKAEEYVASEWAAHNWRAVSFKEFGKEEIKQCRMGLLRRHYTPRTYPRTYLSVSSVNTHPTLVYDASRPQIWYQPGRLRAGRDAAGLPPADRQTLRNIRIGHDPGLPARPDGSRPVLHPRGRLPRAMCIFARRSRISRNLIGKNVRCMN
jgi:carnitine O-acetyltransferase